MVILLFILGTTSEVKSLNSPKDPPNKWLAHPMYISPFAGSPIPLGYSVNQIRTAYNLPSSGGEGTTIAIIDVYDVPAIQDYFDTFSHQFDLPDSTTGNFIVHKMGTNMETDSTWALETCLDVEWAHAIAPDAKILLVEAASATDSSLLAAVDYATSQPGVVAVSMSWGDEEMSSETSSNYESHFNKPGITFFAASGDDGATVMWPAASARVVSVGGTTLNLRSNGQVISETAWGNSSGGVSKYVAAPSFQTNFGLDYPNRAVPDVSYNANASTGVSVYNGTWWKMGGTSAGAPQWAAIHALGLSSTNSNLYNKAGSAYSAYFRDITSGSNNLDPAGTGYDLVTGLGSPLTSNFNTEVTITPTSGTPNSPVTINGVGFNPDSSVDLSYLNPATSTWTPIDNIFSTDSGSFSYTTNVPDLAQNNRVGDHSTAYDYIVFRAHDDSNNRFYNATAPFAEGRRGLTQINDMWANGLFGNNTGFASTVIVQTGQSLTVSGQWFSPGTASLLWDNTISLGTVEIDETGFFDAAFQVPTTTAGQHRLTINDASSNFCVNITRLPSVASDYVDKWHTSDTTVNLTPDYALNEVFYRINGGPVCTLTNNGQPIITTEGTSNTLEYWGTWNVYGTGTMELPHATLTGIKLDKTAPTGSITTSSTTQTSTVTLTLSATDATSGITQMRFSNDGVTYAPWEPYATSKIWNVPGE